MTTKMPPDREQQLFLGLVTDLVTQTWIAMGKIKSPVSDKIERSIPAASILIDMLDMLVVKTKGNLSEEEAIFINESLKQLKLNFVTEANKPDEPAGNGEEVSNDEEKNSQEENES